MQIYDYVILSNTTKSSMNGDTYEFLIPPTYYNEKRSAVAQVEMCQVNIRNSGTETATYITTNLGANNVYHGKGKTVLGVVNNFETPQYSSQPLAISTAARPDKIDVTFHEEDDSMTTPASFMIVLKFSYGNQRETSETIQYQN